MLRSQSDICCLYDWTWFGVCQIYRAKIAGLVADRYGIITDSNIGHWDNVRVSTTEVDDFCLLRVTAKFVG